MIRSFLLFAVAVMAGLYTLQVSAPAWAQCVAGAPCIHSSYAPDDGNNDPKAGDSAACDGDFMNQIIARAHLEAERENILNRFSIKKPDSVLEYSCFDRFLNHVAQNAPPLFSENDEWNNAPVPLTIRHAGAGNPASINIQVFMESGHITSRMTQTVSAQLAAFVNTNFSHNVLGVPSSYNITLPASTSPGAYGCSNMAVIWNMAKCQNFPDPQDTFWTFSELVGGDPRTLAPACTGANNNVDNPKIEVARNAAPAFETARVDTLNLFMPLVNPAADAAGCGAPVPTGLTVISYDVPPGPYTPSATSLSGRTRTLVETFERTCVNPGCYYNGTICTRG